MVSDVVYYWKKPKYCKCKARFLSDEGIRISYRDGIACVSHKTEKTLSVGNFYRKARESFFLATCHAG